MNKPPIKNLRWYIAILLCLASELNYLDRQTLSVLAATIQRDLHLSTVDYSHITSSFLISYAIMYAISGRVIDFLGARLGFILFVCGWSVASLLHGLANSALQFQLFRFLLGVAEPANFPAGVKAVAEWFPMKERSLAAGIFLAGTAVGSALAVPVVSWMALEWGWRSAFFMTGSLGFIWVVVWATVYRSPQEHTRISAQERALIAAGAGEPEAGAKKFATGKLLRMPETWGCALARALTDPISYFLAFWIPLYFEKERGFALAQVGLYVWIPYLALTLGWVASGAIPRFLISRGWSVNRSRKTTMLTVSCAMPLLCFSVTRVSSPALALAIMALLMFGHSTWGNVTLPAEVFPKAVVGTVSGFGGALGAAVGALTQWYIGLVIERYSFTPIFSACAVAYLIAFVLVHWLVGELGVVRQLAPIGSGARVP